MEPIPRPALAHDHASDGRDLDRAERVLDYVARVWRRPVILTTVDDRGARRLDARPN